MGVGRRLDLDDRDFDRSAAAFDAGRRHAEEAVRRLGRVDAMRGANPIAGGILSAQVQLASSAAVKASGTAERQSLTMRRHAALTRIADGDPTGQDFITALPFLQRYDRPKPPSWWTQLRQLMGQAGSASGTIAKNPTHWLAAMEKWAELHGKELAAQAGRLRRQATNWTWPAGIAGKLKSAAGWAGHQWTEAKRRIELAKVSVKRAMASAVKKLSFAVNLAMSVNSVLTAPNDREAARAAIRAATSTFGAAVGGILGAGGGPLGGAGGAFLGSVIGDEIGKRIADGLLGPEPAPPKAIPGL